MGEAAGVAAGGSPGVTVLVAPPPPRGCRWGFSKAPPKVMVRSALKELQNRLHLRSGSWSSSPASLAARKRGSRSWRSMWMKTPGCGEWWDPATRVKELLVDCSKPTEASVSGLLEKIWGMQKPTREKDSHCPQSQQQQYCGPGAVSRTPCASGPEVSSLTLKIKVTGFSLVWPGSMPTHRAGGRVKSVT